MIYHHHTQKVSSLNLSSKTQEEPIVLSPGRLNSMEQVSMAHKSSFFPKIDLNTQAHWLRFKPFEKIFNIHDEVQGFYLVKNGLVKIISKIQSVRGRTNNENFISQLVGHHEYFGLIDFFLHQHHNYQATTLTLTEVLFFPRSYIEQSIKKGDSWIQNIHSYFAEALKNIEEQNKYFYLASVREKIAYTLLTLAQKLGHRTPSGIEIHLKLNRSELAQLAGTINESLSRHLSELKEEKIVDIQGKKIIILNELQLRKKAGYK